MPTWNLEERLEISGRGSEFRMNNIEKRIHLSRTEGRGGFQQMQAFWGGEVRGKGQGKQRQKMVP